MLYDKAMTPIGQWTLILIGPFVLQHKCCFLEVSGGEQIIHSEFANVFRENAVKG